MEQCHPDPLCQDRRPPQGRRENPATGPSTPATTRSSGCCGSEGAQRTRRKVSFFILFFFFFFTRPKGHDTSVSIAAAGGAHHGRIEYDLDDDDVEWLRTLNTQQALEHKPALSEDQYERLMDKFEREYALIEKEKMEESLQEGNVETLGNTPFYTFIFLFPFLFFGLRLFFSLCVDFCDFILNQL